MTAPNDVAAPLIDPDIFDAAAYAAQFDRDGDLGAVLATLPRSARMILSEAAARLAGLTPTYHLGGPVFSPERVLLHRMIIDEALSDDVIAAAMPVDDERPMLIVLGGRGGSGKSWFRGRVYDPERCVVIDADVIKSRLPGYEGWNAALYHEESGLIADRIARTARNLGLNVVMDRTLKTLANTQFEMGFFESAGYDIEIYYMFLPRVRAAARAVTRFLSVSGGRLLPIEVVLANQDNEANFDVLRRRALRWAFYDNNVELGEEPKLVSASTARA